MLINIKDNQQHAASKPAITYPCVWLYKVIGTDADTLARAVTTACPTINSITPSKTSSGGKPSLKKKLTLLNSKNGIRGCNEIKRRGHFLTAPKYCSLNVKIEVVDEASRLAIYQNLKNHLAVKAVL